MGEMGVIRMGIVFVVLLAIAALFFILGLLRLILGWLHILPPLEEIK